jgi:hypothetical protein
MKLKDKLRDHDHITGLYRGCACNTCHINFNYKTFKTPAYFHNLIVFDGHLITQGLNKLNFKSNFEKHMTFSFGNFRFFDSFAFLSFSIDKLSSNLTKDQFKYTPDNEFY